MGVTSNKYMQEEQERVNRQKQNSVNTGGYNLSPVSSEKRAATPKVTQPQVVYTAGKQPQNYTSRYQPVLDSIMEQIQNPEAFKYEFNGDELFKNYADLYTQYGKQAMLDTMGQATGLTGGYGNSYAQNVGQQAYQQYLLPLYDKGMDLRNTAYQSYRDELGDLQNYYNMLQAAENADYGRYQDAMNAWQTQQNLDEQKRQYDADMAFKREQWQHQLELEAASAAAAEAAAAGGGGNGGGGGKETVYGYNGNFYKKDENGNLVKATAAEAKKNGVNMMLQNMYNSVGGAAGKTGTVNATVSKVTDPEKIKRLYGLK